MACASVGVQTEASMRLIRLTFTAVIAVLGFAATLAHAQEPLIVPTAPVALHKGRTLTVIGVGRERGAPDIVDLRVAVEQTGPTAQAASSAAAKAAAQVLEALRKQVGPDGRVDTSNFQLMPVYRTDNPAPVRQRGPEIIGYTAVNELAVRTRQLDAVGTLVDASITAGAARIANLAFTLENPAPLQARALRAAGIDAAAQAAAIAESLHVTLKNVLEVTTDSLERPLPKSFGGAMMRADAAMATTPIEPGEVTAEAHLRVTYAIE
jgi:uncharacterized protein